MIHDTENAAFTADLHALIMWMREMVAAPTVTMPAIDAFVAASDSWHHMNRVLAGLEARGFILPPIRMGADPAGGFTKLLAYLRKIEPHVASPDAFGTPVAHPIEMTPDKRPKVSGITFWGLLAIGSWCRSFCRAVETGELTGDMMNSHHMAAFLSDEVGRFLAERGFVGPAIEFDDDPVGFFAEWAAFLSTQDGSAHGVEPAALQ